MALQVSCSKNLNGPPMTGRAPECHGLSGRSSRVVATYSTPNLEISVSVETKNTAQCVLCTLSICFSKIFHFPLYIHQNTL
jgi:hypothetical protein